MSNPEPTHTRSVTCYFTMHTAHWLGVHEAVVPDAVVPTPDEVAWHGWLTEPKLRSALPEWRFTPDSHEAFSRYLAFRTAQS
jgi:hypothetical protein